jgi:SAM-dependent methyltransferase
MWTYKNYDTPSIFRGAREYKEIPEALELAQATFNEEGLYVAITEFAQQWFRYTQRSARVLDLCSATGLSALRVSQVIPVSSVTLVEIDNGALIKALDHFDKSLTLYSFCADAVSFRDSRPFDLILMNSAYHHIEDSKKTAFLRNAAHLLAEGGAILMGEHFLPSYRSDEEFRQSVVSFYKRLIDELENRGEPAEAINVIRRSGLYCWEGIYEYKVSWERFSRDLNSAELYLLKSNVVWSYPDRRGAPSEDTDKIGSFGLWLIPEQVRTRHGRTNDT